MRACERLPTLSCRIVWSLEEKQPTYVTHSWCNRTTDLQQWVLRRSFLASLDRLRVWWLLHFAHPSHVRLLYQQVYSHPPQSLMEFGVVPQRTLTLLQLIRCGPAEQWPRYAAVDEFESAQDVNSVNLKEFYRTLRGLGIEPRLLPGNLESISPCWANQVRDIDLLVVWGNRELARESRAWLFLPRMLSEHGQIWWESLARGKPSWHVIPKEKAQRLAEDVLRRRAA